MTRLENNAKPPIKTGSRQFFDEMSALGNFLMLMERVLFIGVPTVVLIGIVFALSQ